MKRHRYQHAFASIGDIIFRRGHKCGVHRRHKYGVLFCCLIAMMHIYGRALSPMKGHPATVNRFRHPHGQRQLVLRSHHPQVDDLHGN